MKIALIIYGPPGSGKSTQAKLAADEFDLFHFDTGRYLEAVVNDPKNAKNTIIQKEKKNFDTGILVDPAFVLKIVKQKVMELGKSGQGVVFSGSPRTLFEAKGLMPVLEKIYGKKNIYPVVIQVSPETSIHRNSTRIVCVTCRSTALAGLVAVDFQIPFCLFCGAEYRRRSLDQPEIIKVRLKEYAERTEPIFAFLKKRGYHLHEIDGEPPPHQVFEDILKTVRGDMAKKGK